MPQPAIPIALLALIAPAAALENAGERTGRAGADDAPVDGIIRYAQMTIRQRVILRVPRITPSADRVAPLPPIEWKEKKGPKCVPGGELAGALVTSKAAVDFVMNGGRRVRAKLDGDCRQMDYYSGFYLKPAADGMICVKRDTVRVRSGASCVIEEFKHLVPKN